MGRSCPAGTPDKLVGGLHTDCQNHGPALGWLHSTELFRHLGLSSNPDANGILCSRLECWTDTVRPWTLHLKLMFQKANLRPIKRSALGMGK